MKNLDTHAVLMTHIIPSAQAEVANTLALAFLAHPASGDPESPTYAEDHLEDISDLAITLWCKCRDGVNHSSLNLDALEFLEGRSSATSPLLQRVREVVRGYDTTYQITPAQEAAILQLEWRSASTTFSGLCDGALMFEFAGMVVGIEPDGYTHS